MVNCHLSFKVALRAKFIDAAHSAPANDKRQLTIEQ